MNTSRLVQSAYRVIGDQGGVGMLAALEQAGAADPGNGALPGEPHEQLVAHDGATGGEQEFVEAGMGADRRHQGGDMERPGAPAGDLDVIDMRGVADLELERRIHLVLIAIRADMAFDQHRARPLLDHDERADEHRRGLLARIHENKMDRPRQRSALRDPDHRAVTHESGIERDRHVVGRDELSQMRNEMRIAGSEPLRHRADGEAGFQVGQIGEFRRKDAIDEDDSARLDRREHGHRLPGARLRRRIGRVRERLGIAHERAQVGIFPLLDPAVRQPFGFEAMEGSFAQRGHRSRAREARA